MRKIAVCSSVLAAVSLGAGCVSSPRIEPAAKTAEEPSVISPAPLDVQKVEQEIASRYAKAHPEVQEYVRWTATSFGRTGLWLNEDAFAALSPEAREKRIASLAALLKDSEYGRHLCRGLAEAGALKDSRLVPGLLAVAGYQREDVDYDCRPKWMAVAALARQESDASVPLLIGLVDHGNQNTRMWARAALARHTRQDFGKDKDAWAKWWQAQGHAPIAPALLRPWKMPSAEAK